MLRGGNVCLMRLFPQNERVRPLLCYDYTLHIRPAAAAAAAAAGVDVVAKDGPTYRDLLPTPPPPGLVPSCAEGGVLGILPGVVGCIQVGSPSQATVDSCVGLLCFRCLLFFAVIHCFSKPFLGIEVDLWPRKFGHIKCRVSTERLGQKEVLDSETGIVF